MSYVASCGLVCPRITPTGKQFKSGFYSGQPLWSEAIRVELPNGFCALLPLMAGTYGPEYDEALIDRATELEQRMGGVGAHG
jgi:hypothetical protein